jgi:hypothetical protein
MIVEAVLKAVSNSAAILGLISRIATSNIIDLNSEMLIIASQSI